MFSWSSVFVCPTVLDDCGYVTYIHVARTCKSPAAFTRNMFGLAGQVVHRVFRSRRVHASSKRRCARMCLLNPEDEVSSAHHVSLAHAIPDHRIHVGGRRGARQSGRMCWWVEVCLTTPLQPGVRSSIHIVFVCVCLRHRGPWFLPPRVAPYTPLGFPCAPNPPHLSFSLWYTWTFASRASASGSEFGLDTPSDTTRAA
jgi:hypothetical protein